MQGVPRCRTQHQDAKRGSPQLLRYCISIDDKAAWRKHVAEKRCPTGDQSSFDTRAALLLVDEVEINRFQSCGEILGLFGRSRLGPLKKLLVGADPHLARGIKRCGIGKLLKSGSIIGESPEFHRHQHD